MTELLIKFITAMAWVVGSVLTTGVIVNIFRGHSDLRTGALLLMVAADAWLIARYLL